MSAPTIASAGRQDSRWLSIALILSTVALVGSACSDPTADAKQRFGMVKRAGNNGEICAAAKAVAASYLEKKNDYEYRMWNVQAVLDCSKVLLDGASSYPTSRGVSAIADRLEAEAENAAAILSEHAE